jgi:DNA-binding MarR family transcriptional regulator
MPVREEAKNGGGRSLRRPALLAWLRLARVYHKVDRATAERLRPWGLTVGGFDLLAQLGTAEGSTQQQLADRLLVTKGNVSQLVDRAERAGLIRRCQAGRANRLYLTEAGRALWAAVVPAQEEAIVAGFAALSAAEQRRLLGLLRALDHGLR